MSSWNNPFTFGPVSGALYWVGTREEAVEELEPEIEAEDIPGDYVLAIMDDGGYGVFLDGTKDEILHFVGLVGRHVAMDLGDDKWWEKYR